MHREAHEWVAQHATDATVRLLDVGGRDINGTVRGLFPNADYTSIDLIDGAGVDIVGDVTTYKPDSKFDVVVCCEVLEHTDADIIGAAHRLLRNGGQLIFTAAGVTRVPHSAIDGGPLRPDEYYGNVTRDQLEGALKGWQHVTIDETGPDIRAVATR